MKTKYLLIPFSYIFHPIFISLYGAGYFLLFMGKEILSIQFYFSLLQIIILTIVIPLGFYFLLKTFNKVKTFTEATLEERKFPIFIQMLLLYYLLKLGLIKDFFPELNLFFEAGFYSSFLVFISVVLRFKASLHMIGVTSLLIYVFQLTNYYQLHAVSTICTLIMCCGFVASSRLFMKAHTYQELVVGMLIGGLPQFLVWYLR